MTGPRDYTRGTRAALAQLSKGACYYPDCDSPIIRFIDGDPYVNYEIAHILDAKPGNRYSDEMTDEERRAFSNLILLCKPHHTLVDKTHPERFSPTELKRWKSEREGPDSAVAGGLEDLTEDRLEAMILDVLAAVANSPSGAAVAGVAKACALLSAEVRMSRKAAAGEIAAWRRTWDQTRSSHVLWNAETGERLFAEPSRLVTSQHRQAVDKALDAAAGGAEAYIASVGAEVASLRATAVHLRPWCDEVVRAAEQVFLAAGRWPTPPPFEDDDALDLALDGLDRAVDALSAKWRGEDVGEPSVPEPLVDAPETPEQAQFREHAELLEDARRYHRATSLPYDRAIEARLLAATIVAASLPPVPTMLPYGIDATTSLAAAVARNADDHEFDELLELCVTGPVLGGAWVAHQLARIAAKAGDAARERAARQAAVRSLVSAVWTEAEFWKGLGSNARSLLNLNAFLTTADDTRQIIRSALSTQPGILPHVILGCAEWTEHRDFHDWSLLGFRRRYSVPLPEWFPAAEVVAAIESAMPGVAAHEEPDGPELDSLAAQLLFVASADAT